MSPFQRLGIDFNADVQQVKLAYAALIKTYRPDSHPAEFASIREAYEKALAIVQQRRPPGSTPPEVRLQEDDTLVDWPRDGDATGRLSRWILHLNAATPHVPDLPRPVPRQGDLPPRMLLRDDVVRARSVDRPRPVRESMPKSTPVIRDELFAILATSNAEGENAAAPRLEALLARSRSVLLQERIDLEHCLVRWIASSVSPPLVLAGIAAKEFDWADPGRTRRDFLEASPDARLMTVTALALDLAWFRHGGRPWLRHVFGTQASPPVHGVFAATSVLQEARRWSAHWSDRAKGVDVAVDRYIDAAALYRLHQGAVLQSTDLLMGVVVASLLSIFLVDRIDGFARAIEVLAAVACATTLVSAVGRAAAHAIGHSLSGSARWRSIASAGVHPFFVVATVFLVGALLAILGSGAWQGRGYVVMAVACAPLVGWAFQAVWTIIESTEDRLVASRLDLRTDRDRSRFENPPSPIGGPHGGRRARDAGARSRLQQAARRGERPPTPGIRLRVKPWAWRVTSMCLFVAMQIYFHFWR